MRSFFQQLEDHQVSYLLVSGQAAVLHGAALFSEDIDLWVEPETENMERLLQALRAGHARYHKLTPPLTFSFAMAGHGFHFVIPGEEETGDFYLDVMGCPPRVEDFQSCRHRSQNMATDWGTLPVIGRRDLVEIKKTQRLRDYPVISRLALQELQSNQEQEPALLFDWVWSHLFELEDAERFMKLSQGRLADWIPGDDRDARWVERVRNGSDHSGQDMDLEERMLARMARYRQSDRLYWKQIIEELKTLRVEGALQPEGGLV